MGRSRHAHRAGSETCARARRLSFLDLVLLALAAGALALFPAWLGALLGLPLD